MESFNMGKYTCRYYGCLCATCLVRCREYKSCENNCDKCRPELHEGVSRCEKYLEKAQTVEYIGICVHKYHDCIRCIFSKIRGREYITKAKGMCKLRPVSIDLPFAGDEGITKAEAYQMLSDLSTKDRKNYII